MELVIIDGQFVTYNDCVTRILSTNYIERLLRDNEIRD